jgi:hypothetical protein
MSEAPEPEPEQTPELEQDPETEPDEAAREQEPAQRTALSARLREINRRSVQNRRLK